MSKKKKPNKAKAGAGKTSAAKPVIEGKADEPKKKKTNPLEFFQQVRNEGSKVTWTSRNETMVSTIMVLIMVAIMAVFFFAVDQGLRYGVCNLLPIECVSQNN